MYATQEYYIALRSLTFWFEDALESWTWFALQALCPPHSFSSFEEQQEEMARQIPYVLDQSTWETRQRGGNPTEALIDNWQAVGLIADWETIQILKKLKKGREMDPDDYVDPEETAGKMKKLLELAQEFGIPVFDRECNELWSPE